MRPTVSVSQLNLKFPRIIIIKFPLFFSPPVTPVYDCYGHTSPIKEDHFFDMDELNQLELDSRAPQDVPPEPIREGEAAHIYENYSFDHTYPADLPITKFQEQILQTIESNSVTVIQGEQLVLSIPGF